MEKIKLFQPELITRNFFPDWVGNPERINQGQCFIWAYACAQAFSEIVLMDNYIHAFVKYRGKFYDSERLKGEADWRDLPATTPPPFTGFIQEEAHSHSIYDFKREWESETRRFQTSWGELDQKINLLLKAYKS